MPNARRCTLIGRFRRHPHWDRAQRIAFDGGGHWQAERDATG
jgi:hypothetical protein